MIQIPAVSVGDLCAGDVMSSPVTVCREEMLLGEAASLIASKDISGLPVVDASGELVGMVSERDLAHALGSPLVRLAVRRPYHRALSTKHIEVSARRVGDVMTEFPISAAPETPLRALAEIMVKEEISRIPIVRHRELVGIVTKGDVLRAVGGLSRRHVVQEREQEISGSGIQDSVVNLTPTS